MCTCILCYSLAFCEARDWAAPEHAPAHLWVDARSTPPRCAAVLVLDGAIYFTDGKPSQSVCQRLLQRQDNQIMALEILAISTGLSTFQGLLKGRKVIIYSDNKGAEVSLQVMHMLKS